MKGLLWLVVVVVVLVAAFCGYQYWKLKSLASQYASAKEIAKESIENDGPKWKIHMESVLAQPIDKVWKALQQPERSHEFMDSFKKSELKSSEGNKKVVEFQLQVLTLPPQTFLSDLTFDEPSHTVTVKTLSGPQDLNATYRLKAIDAAKTLLVYDATAVNRVSVPLPMSVQKGAIREIYVNQIRAIEKGIASEDAKMKPAA
jgi:carbon monoxide dehydrogenase subunit G